MHLRQNSIYAVKAAESKENPAVIAFREKSAAKVLVIEAAVKKLVQLVMNFHTEYVPLFSSDISSEQDPKLFSKIKNSFDNLEKAVAMEFVFRSVAQDHIRNVLSLVDDYMRNILDDCGFNDSDTHKNVYLCENFREFNRLSISFLTYINPNTLGLVDSKLRDECFDAFKDACAHLTNFIKYRNAQKEEEILNPPRSCVIL